MCFEPDASPPIPNIDDASVEHRDFVLGSSDGNDLLAFEALGGGPAGVVILPDVRGLFGFYKQLAICFAQEGHDAVAIDYFGRTAGLDEREEDFDFMDHVRQTTFEGVKADTAAAVAHLRAADADRPIFTIGFCFGGSGSWHQAANGHGLAGAIGFYGHPNRVGMSGDEPVASRAADIECPILGLMGGADTGIPEEEIEVFRRAMNEAGITHDVHSYPGAPHSFFDRSYSEYATESTDAWARVLEFIGTNSG
jgi:carboxymethylenebutenolidase